MQQEPGGSVVELSHWEAQRLHPQRPFQGAGDISRMFLAVCHWER